jgi:CHAT domain-containing protein/tetratricopeptide (TPR) repeat protein
MRPADTHLTPQEFESLLLGAADSIASNDYGASTLEAQQHLNGCAVCQSAADRYHYVEAALKGLRSRGKALLMPPAGGTYCPVEQVWLSLAAGLIKEDEAACYVTHAAQCDWCGPLLKESMEDLAPDVTGEEEELLAKLPSASGGWQREMGKKLAQGSQSLDAEKNIADEESRRKHQRLPTRRKLNKEVSGFHSWARWGWVAAAAVVIAVGLGVFLSKREPAVTQLLAQAYTESRTLEVRIAGAGYAPMRIERGKDRSSFEKPASLLKAEDLISEHLRNNPNDPVWMQAEARADLLDKNYESAIGTLQHALEILPESPELQTDLGSAYFLHGKSADLAGDYAKAVEAYSLALAKAPDDPVALFNRALACEQIPLYFQSAEDWAHYLRIDPRGGWADEARVNLQRVKKRLAERSQRSQVPLLSPGEYARVMGLADEENISALDQRVERYFDAAMRYWLPQAYAQSTEAPGAALDAQRALAGLAVLLKNRHDDAWLAEFLEEVKSTEQKKAILDLVSSSDAVRVGRYELGVSMARRSLSGFQQSRNRAGVLWSDFALMYADTFSLHYADCIRIGSAAIRQIKDMHYQWLHAQLTIQLGECQAATVYMQEAINTELEGARLSEKFHYPSLALRANSFAATSSLYAGNFDHGLNKIAENLAMFWQSDISDTRGQNLYTALSEFAEARDWPNTNAFATAELIADFPSKDTLDQAIEYQLLALAQERADNHVAAQSALQKASNLLAVVQEDQAVVIRKAEMALQNARISLHMGDAQRAIALLGEFSQQFKTVDFGQFQGEYFKTYGESLLALGRKSEALGPLQQALSITERYLTGFRLEAARLSWSRLQSELYRDILTIKLSSGDPSEALAWWEWYKGASLRTSLNFRAKANTIRPTNFVSLPLSSYILPRGNALVSYVLFSTNATAFVFREGKTKIYTLPFAGDIEPLVLRFLRHCSTPNSDLQVLEVESIQLYEILVAPFEADLRGANALQIETDGFLDRVPFDLLHEAHDPYLADRFDLTFSPGLAYNLPVAREPLSHESSALIVAVGDAQGPGMPALPEAAQEGIDVASHFRHAKLMAERRITREQLLRNLSESRLFHFAGHAVANAVTVGLVLGQDSILDAQSLAAVDLRKLQLAVLSGCDTANGGDGAFTDVNSLARTFIGARVPSVVASRWRVDSDATRQLMHLFYASLLSGKTPTSALRAATTTLRNKSGYQNPYYWGSFAVFGRS